MSDSLKHQEEWAEGNGIAAAMCKLNGGTDAAVKAEAEKQLELCCDAHFSLGSGHCISPAVPTGRRSPA